MTTTTKESNKYLLLSGDAERQKLDVNFWLISLMGLLLFIAIYTLTLLFLRPTFVGVLLYERGFTQFLVIYLACFVVSLTVIKLIKLQQESVALRRSWVPQTVTFDNPRSRDLLTLQNNLTKQNQLLPIRCSRILGAYIQSGSRKVASELALDDSTFYLSATETSYTFPRVLVWAIPLLGFIGTVIGISQAVNGFSSFLEQAGEIEQIKEGIGTVTSGLAVAFDTTLLALLLSVLVMIPLVLVERMESRLLLRIDIYINDFVLPRFKEKGENLDYDGINQSVRQAFQDYLPNPEALIQPAEMYAKQAVENFSQSFITEIGKLQQLSGNLMEQIEKINNMSLEEKSKFLETLDQQVNVNRQLSQSMITEIKHIQPILEKLSKPRLITFTDSEEL
ncbi:MotA/TolQ/ExbB proton channel family protein [Crocosphaera watsonii WH 8501]|uniref:MotA/TolQ/ExbB proton channel n=2 Tax=Crocosphaera watsonii TaxID=263511 RepID=Q4C941_CROWT|nr:MotA/TolQ/ExbB proton channel family protein [Crocosphaera watsonii]EAM52080.1 MotA/TolQ/ExbB proton channel [Crocosphaera watsonii WH 8501]CCQ53142.1 Conserved domain protein [Crocosphaera watsonii WH 8502]